MPVINAKVVLCDIEGTTTSINFVKDVLFLYAKRHAFDYLKAHWNESATKQIIADLIELAEFKDFQRGFNNQTECTVDTIAEFVIYLIDKDLKLGPLKTLQGLIWNLGYIDGTIKGHIYEDVPQAFKKWKQDGIKICIYSSGSVMAQKMLFGNSDFGNLMPYIADYFDTAIGSKRETKSYTNIVQKLDAQSKDILFLTDITAEGKAAMQAGMQVIILQRPGNVPLSQNEQLEYTTVKDFNEIQVCQNCNS